MVKFNGYVQVPLDKSQFTDEEWKNRQLTFKGIFQFSLDFIILAFYTLAVIASLRLVSNYYAIEFWFILGIIVLIFERIIIYVSRITSPRDNYEVVIIKKEVKE